MTDQPISLDELDARLAPTHFDDERRQTCDHCGLTQPLTDLSLWWGAGVHIECKDTAACKTRGQIRHARYADPDHDDECEAEFVPGAFTWTLCRCAERLEDEDGNLR